VCRIYVDVILQLQICACILGFHQTDGDGFDHNEATGDLLLVQRPMESMHTAAWCHLCCWFAVESMAVWFSVSRSEVKVWCRSVQGNSTSSTLYSVDVYI